jgi:DNA polymerase-3 subunit epsilon
VTDSVQPELFSLSDDAVLVVDAASIPDAGASVSGDAGAADNSFGSAAWWHRLAVFDLETTGIDVETSRIVTANVSVIGEDGHPVSRIDWLANPGIEIPQGATAVHGVTTERAVAEGRPAALVVYEIVDALRALMAEGVPLVIYNAPYDLTLLHHEAVRYGIDPLELPAPIIDPLVIDRAVDRYRKGKRTLEAAAVVYGVELLDAHDAGADAIAAGRVAQALARKHDAVSALAIHELHEKQIDWFREQAESFQEYMRRTHNPEFTARTAWPVG